MSKQRLEAFTDGVVAIIITIMVLSIPLPASFENGELLNFMNSILIYLISFIVVGAFWNQHHRIFNYVHTIDHKIIAGNFFFLFFLSLLPLFTKWVIDNQGSLLPVIAYDMTYLLVSFCYMLIFRLIMQDTQHNELKRVIEKIENIKQKNYSKKMLLIPLLITTILVGVLILLSVFLPRLSVFILLGIPVISSLVNLFVEDRTSRMIQKAKK